MLIPRNVGRVSCVAAVPVLAVADTFNSAVILLCLISLQTTAILHTEILQGRAHSLPLKQRKLPPLFFSKIFIYTPANSLAWCCLGFPLKADTTRLVIKLPLIYMHLSKEIVNSSKPGYHVRQYACVPACAGLLACMRLSYF